MNFTLQNARLKDLNELSLLMSQAHQTMEHPEWFAADDDVYLKKHLEKHGFIVTAWTDEGTLAGFFVIKYPSVSENYLGHLLNFSDTQLQQTVYMDSAVVSPTFQGNHLQSRMLQNAEAQLKNQFEHCLCLATVHPDNRFSLTNMQKNGYEIQLTTALYGGLPRHVLLKELC